MCPVVLIAGEQSPDAAADLMAVWVSTKFPRRSGRGISTRSHRHAGRDGRAHRTARRIAGEVRAPCSEHGQHARRHGAVADGNAYHGGGASEAQELAAMLATLVAYLRACEAAGVAPDKAMPKIAVSLAADADQFMTIAKLRAARRLVWRVAEASGAGSAAAHVHFTAVTAWRMMSKRDPWTNILRTTIACAGAALGGADAILVLPVHLCARPARPLRAARRAQHPDRAAGGVQPRPRHRSSRRLVVRREADRRPRPEGLGAVPGDRSAKGGMAAALKSGFVQDEIAKTVEARAKAIATGRQELTGVSAFPLLGDDGVKAEPWPRARRRRRRRPIEVMPLKMARLAEPFEALRDAADAHAAKSASRCQVFLASHRRGHRPHRALDLDQELPRRRRHRGADERRLPERRGRRQAFKASARTRPASAPRTRSTPSTPRPPRRPSRPPAPSSC